MTVNILVKMVFNKKTGKKDILIDYDGDESSLPIEHEREHRQIVEHLLGKGVLRPEDVGNVSVARGTSKVSDEKTESQPQPSKPVAVGN